jgi:hypothetical protein
MQKIITHLKNHGSKHGNWLFSGIELKGYPTFGLYYNTKTKRFRNYGLPDEEETAKNIKNLNYPKLHKRVLHPIVGEFEYATVCFFTGKELTPEYRKEIHEAMKFSSCNAIIVDTKWVWKEAVNDAEPR